LCVMMSEEPPIKRMRRMMDDVSYWETEHALTPAKRVRVLQFILTHPNSSNREKFLAVTHRMENFQYEDKVADKLNLIWHDYKPPANPAEEREDFLEIAATMSSLFKCRSIIYCDEANDPRKMDLYP